MSGHKHLSSSCPNVQFFTTTSDLWSTVYESYHPLDLRINAYMSTNSFPEDHTGKVVAQGLTEALA